MEIQGGKHLEKESLNTKRRKQPNNVCLQGRAVLSWSVNNSSCSIAHFMKINLAHTRKLVG